MVSAQSPLGRLRGLGNMGSSQGGDSLEHRTGLEDSITIRFRYLDTTRYNNFDSSLNDFSLHFPAPNNYQVLGNTGAASKPLMFSPILTSGWDAGFHAFDYYRLKFSDTKFYNTTKPYSEIGYLIGSGSEQVVHVLHTQNVSPDFNFALNYDLISAPGFFKNQNTNHNSYRFNASFQSKRRRYHGYLILLSNRIQNSENGGIRSDEDYLDNVAVYKNRLIIPVQLGDYIASGRNPYDSKLLTGNRQTNFSFLLRQQYDLGQRDSVVHDTVTTYLFYPRLRLEHNLQYASYSYLFFDQQPDTQYYKKNYNFLQTPSANFRVNEDWKELINDFSFYTFPDAKNPQQFLKLGASLQNLKANLDGGTAEYYNIFLHGEYRNKTRDKKWDIEAAGKFYATGLNAGDYDALITLQRFVSRKLGYLQAGFQNVNRSPSFIFENASSFSIGSQPSFNKENITSVFARIDQPENNLRLTGRYMLISNYTYFRNFYQASQASGLFNVLQVTADKQLSLSKRWKVYVNANLQQKTGSAPVNLPLFFGMGRISYNGTLGFKNLAISTGLDVRYNTPYKADTYSPVLSQFVIQNDSLISMKLPTVSIFMHFRIRSFTAYVRGENLNTARVKDGFGFTNNNLAAPGYPMPGLQFRVGIFWSFVN
jgi:Putative porin